MGLFDRSASKLATSTTLLLTADPGNALLDAARLYDPEVRRWHGRLLFRNGVLLFGPVAVTPKLEQRAGLPDVLLCRLDVQRDPMPPGRWTALFFLDEATALAAGHRPCGYCRRLEFLSFAEAWRRARGLAQRPRAGEMDARLHAERVDARSRRQLTRPALAGQLPDGVMIRYGGVPGLLASGRVLPWSFTGYLAPVAVPPDTPVELLTPPATVAAIAAGYRPLRHPSAAAHLNLPA